MTCTRCDHGWFTHPEQGWAVSCPVCDDRHGQRSHRYWLDDGSESGQITSWVPASHPSQAIVPAPEWFREINAQFWAARKAKDAIMRGDS